MHAIQKKRIVECENVVLKANADFLAIYKSIADKIQKAIACQQMVSAVGNFYTPDLHHYRAVGQKLLLKYLQQKELQQKEKQQKAKQQKEKEAAVNTATVNTAAVNTASVNTAAKVRSAQKKTLIRSSRS